MNLLPDLLVNVNEELAFRHCQCNTKDTRDGTDSGKFADYSVSGQNPGSRFENAGYYGSDGDTHSRRQDLCDIERLSTR